MKLYIFIATYLGSIAIVNVGHAAGLRTVTLSGQPAHGTSGGATFESFGPYYFLSDGDPQFRGPVLNDAGQTAFRANLTGSGVDSMNNQGVWSEGSGSLGLVTRTGSAAPGGGIFGTYSGHELFTPVINGAGKTAFFGALSDGNLGLWSEGAGNLALVAREGVHPPILPSGVTFTLAKFGGMDKTIFTGHPLLNDAGQTAFAVGLAGTGVNSTNDFGAWSGVDLNSLATLARSGSPAVGLPVGVSYGLAQLPIGLNDSGQSALISYLQGTGVSSSNDFGFWTGSSGGLALAIRKGNAAPGTPSGVSFGTPFAPLEINNAGKVAFEAFLAGGDVVEGVSDEGLWSNLSGDLQLVARRGNQAAGTPAGVNYGRFSQRSWPLLNDAGQLSFVAGIEGAGVDETNNEGIWLGEPGNLTLVARRGEQAADTPSGVNFSDLHFPTLNTAGQVAFRANVGGDGVDSTNDRGIWVTDASGDLQLIARTGGQMEVAHGDLRTLANLDFVTSTGSGDGRRSAFNNVGQLVFWASFTDGSQGVFVSTTVATVPGDFNFDGTVDTADYVKWRDGLGTLYTQSHYNIWRTNFGASLGPDSGSSLPSAEPLSAAAPEPSTLTLLIMAAIGWRLRRRLAA